MRHVNCGDFWKKEYRRAETSLRNHRAWHIYATAVELDPPFTLDQLQEAIYEKMSIRPQEWRILQEAREFYATYDLPLIQRSEPGSESFTVNTDIDLNNPAYAAAIPPPRRGPGRPPKRTGHRGRSYSLTSDA